MSPLHIFFATVTGNAESLALKAETRAKNAGRPVSSKNLSDITPETLTTPTLALFVVSTWGDGEPPADACDFWYALEQAPLSLPNLRYAVFGLGDRDYSEFNAVARKLDERLTALGAQRLLPRVEADTAFDDAYEAWENEVFATLT